MARRNRPYRCCARGEGRTIRARVLQMPDRPGVAQPKTAHGCFQQRPAGAKPFFTVLIIEVLALQIPPRPNVGADDALRVHCQDELDPRGFDGPGNRLIAGQRPGSQHHPIHLPLLPPRGFLHLLQSACDQRHIFALAGRAESHEPGVHTQHPEPQAHQPPIPIPKGAVFTINHRDGPKPPSWFPGNLFHWRIS